jgi:prepilin-type N-terminal cleavage/methylation domain-containing protein
MKAPMRGYIQSQGGYTLIEVIISVAIGAILMAGLSSVVLTSVRASNVATSRVEASSQIRSFQSFAYGDFAHSAASGLATCTPSPPCTQPIVLTGTQVNSAGQPVGTPYTVTYTWDGSDFLDRQVGSSSLHAATNVSSFSWYVTSGPGLSTVVVNMTVTVHAYSESQSFIFYPRVNP